MWSIGKEISRCFIWRYNVSHQGDVGGYTLTCPRLEDHRSVVLVHPTLIRDTRHWAEAHPTLIRDTRHWADYLSLCWNLRLASPASGSVAHFFDLIGRRTARHRSALVNSSFAHDVTSMTSLHVLNRDSSSDLVRRLCLIRPSMAGAVSQTPSLDWLLLNASVRETAKSVEGANLPPHRGLNVTAIAHGDARVTWNLSTAEPSEWRGSYSQETLSAVDAVVASDVFAERKGLHFCGTKQLMPGPMKGPVPWFACVAPARTPRDRRQSSEVYVMTRSVADSSGH